MVTESFIVNQCYQYFCFRLLLAEGKVGICLRYVRFLSFQCPGVISCLFEGSYVN